MMRHGVVAAILGTVAVTATANLGAQSGTDRSPHRSARIENDGARIHYLEWGTQGPAVILLPGYSLTAHAFDDIATALAGQFHVVALTPRSFGESDAPSDGAYTIATLVDDLRALLDSLHIARAALVGHSLSGTVIASFALRYPERVTRLAFLDSYPYFAEEHGDSVAGLDPIVIPPFAGDTTYDAVARYLRRYRFVPWQPAFDADMRVKPLGAEGARRRALTTSYITDQWVHTPDVSKLAVPTLQLCAVPSVASEYPWLTAAHPNFRAAKRYVGRHLLPFSRRLCRRFETTVPGAQVARLRGSHYLFFTNPVVAARRLKEFLSADGSRVKAQDPMHAAQRIGSARFQTSCDTTVSPRFNIAVAELHSFGFSDAIRDFNVVLRQDPRCAVAYWGVALSEWGNPFVAGAKSAQQLQRGLAAVGQARAIGAPTARERDYITAVSLLYEHADSLDQRHRLLAYRDALAALVASVPADTEAVIFHALAQAAAVDPTDKTYAQQLAAGATLERLFAVLPSHPGLAHYIIHAYDVPALAPRGLVAAHRYAQIAPDISHALHMPSHVYTRIGSWQESIDANVAAAVAAQREGATAEELHASDYEVYAYLQLGQYRAAGRIVAALPGIAVRLDPTRMTTAAPPAAGYYAIAAIPARYAVERGDWLAASRLARRPSPSPQANAITIFATALGAARIRDTALAKKAIADLAQLVDTLAARRELYWREQVDIQRLAADAWFQLAVNHPDSALTIMRVAADREDATEKNAVSPGPLAPARELLGEMFLARGMPDSARVAFEATLKREPNRRRALAGALAVAHARGDQESATDFKRRLRALCSGSDRTDGSTRTSPKSCAEPLR